MKSTGLYANIHAKRKRIKAGSGESMRRRGSKGAPTNKASKTAKKNFFPLLKPNVQSLTKYGHDKVQYHSQKTTQHVARQGDSSSKANTVLPVLFDSLCPLWKEKYQRNDSHSSSNYVHPFKITHLTLMPMLGFIWQDLTIQSARWRIVKKIPT